MCAETRILTVTDDMNIFLIQKEERSRSKRCSIPKIHNSRVTWLKNTSLSNMCHELMPYKNIQKFLKPGTKTFILLLLNDNYRYMPNITWTVLFNLAIICLVYQAASLPGTANIIGINSNQYYQPSSDITHEYFCYLSSAVFSKDRTMKQATHT